jgi:hypothetical protein
LPSAISLMQNYPNPFNSVTSFHYTLNQPGLVRLSIYNLLGQKITTIFEGHRNAGEHAVLWDAAAFPSGVYFARLEAGDRNQSIRVVLLK